MSRRRMYIAGPMRGYPDHNIPAFRAAAERLRGFGHQVVSPVEIGDAWAGGDQSAHAAEDYVRRDLVEVLTCDAMALLPGWEASTGARCEASVAVTLGFAFYDANGFRIPAPPRILIAGGYDKAPGIVDSLDGLAVEVNQWQKATFTKATPASVAEHLYREAKELKRSPSDPEEMADCFMLVVGAAQASNVDLAHAVRQKLETNKARVWGEPDAAGVVEHLAEAAGAR